MFKNRLFRICLIGHRPKDVTQFINSGNIYDMHNSYWVQVINRLYHIIANELRKHPEGLELHSGLALGADTAWGCCDSHCQKAVWTPYSICCRLSLANSGSTLGTRFSAYLADSD